MLRFHCITSSISLLVITIQVFGMEPLDTESRRTPVLDKNSNLMELKKFKRVDNQLLHFTEKYQAKKEQAQAQYDDKAHHMGMESLPLRRKLRAAQYRDEAARKAYLLLRSSINKENTFFAVQNNILNRTFV